MSNKAILKQKRKFQNERGNAGLLAMIFLAFASLTVLTMMTVGSLRDARNLEKSGLKFHEKWQARTGVNILAQIVAKDAPRQIETDVRWARENCNVSSTLPMFDAEDLSQESSPAVVFSGTEMLCAEGNSDEGNTSVFGNFHIWRDGRLQVFESIGQNRFSLDPERIKVVQMDEIYRRTLADSDVAYAVRYIVEAKYGNYRTRTNGELILGANLPSCGTSVELQVNPSTVERGNPVQMQITYSYANRLQIINSAGTLLHEEIVTEQSTSQIFTYNFTPASTDNYRVIGNGSGGCQARSANVTVTVTEPTIVCPRVVDFSASATTINEGETVVINWNIQDAVEVVFEGTPVSAIGSQSFTLNATRTFTITARDATNNCPISRQITVTVRSLPPLCSFSTPQINFSANPNSIGVGETSTLNWNITGLDSSGTAVITGPNAFSQSVGVSGSQIITPPALPGDYTYTLTAENICPDGTRLTASANIVISVRLCPPPDITAFTVNPSTVTSGGNQMIRFAWNIGGTADAVSINNGVGGGLPASGTVDIPQPNITTTYTITAVGCGQTRQAQVTVIVDSCPLPVINSFWANPSTVIAGGNQLVRLSWITSGTVNSLDIGGIGNVTGSFVDIIQPQTTTVYTLTANGCSTATQRQTTVTVNPSGSPIIRDNSGLCWTDFNGAGGSDPITTYWGTCINVESCDGQEKQERKLSFLL